MTQPLSSSLWSLVLRDYATLVVLVVLCGVLSAVTLDRQYPTGGGAGRQIAALLAAKYPGGIGVLIAVGNTAEDRALAEALAQRLPVQSQRVVAAVAGAPADARAAIEQAIARGETIDAIACTNVTARWGVFDRLADKFPSLAETQIVQPESYLWPNFLKSANLLNIANQIAVIAIVAIGMTLVIIGGGIDLSVGSLIALSAVITARLIRDTAGGTEASSAGMILCSAGAIGLCAAVGAITGTLVAYVRIQSFIVTLALMSMASGLAYIVSNGQSINAVPASFTWLGGEADLLGIPNAVVLMAGLYVLAQVAMSRTIFGRHLYAVGGNEKAAWLCGVPVERIRLTTYAASGALAGLGGVVLASQFKSGAPTYGQTYELQVIAAVVVGGTSLAGGEGKMLGTLLGALLIGVVQNGMNLLGVSSNPQKVVLGAVILLAAVLDRAKGVWLSRAR